MRVLRVLSVVLVFVPGAAAALECHAAAEQPAGWSWRSIDGRTCWYRGPRGVPKDQLHWPAEAAVDATQSPAAEGEQADDNDDHLLHSYWPPLPKKPQPGKHS